MGKKFVIGDQVACEDGDYKVTRIDDGIVYGCPKIIWDMYWDTKKSRCFALDRKIAEQ